MPIRRRRSFLQTGIRFFSRLREPCSTVKKETEREIQRPVTVAMLYVHFSWTYRAPLRVVVFFVPLFPLE